VLARFDDYWGDKAKLDKVIFKPIADGPARRQALEAGEIQGYDLVDPADLGALEGAGFQIVERPAFNVGYVGFNTAKPPFDNLKIRQAVAHALNRQALVTAKYPPGAEVAKQFMPPSLFGYADDVPSTSTASRRPRPSSPSPASPTRPSSSGTRPASAVRTCRTRPPTSRRSRPT
jgi:peptide/nickel transport system substrate-binding protein